jgi:peptide/nickel transport system substrate-binding protein
MRAVVPLVALSVALSVACSRNEGSKAGAPAAARRSLTIGISQEPDTLWLPFKEMSASEEVARPTGYTLTQFDENWQLVPWAAERIPTVEGGDLELFEEGGVQKMRTRWRIRPEFNWADGKPLIADDFITAFRIYNDPELEVVDRSVAEKVEKMEAEGEDRRTLVVTWRQVFAGYADYRQHEALPTHIVGPLLEERATGAAIKLKQHPFGTRPLLAGAFTITEWVPGSHIIAERNPHATGFLKPRLDKIVWRIIPKTNTLAANLLSGNIDAISPIGMTFDQALELEELHGKEVDVQFTEGLVWEHIDFDLAHPILGDKRVRQALAHGCDRELIVKELFGGRQPVAHGTHPARSQFHNPDVRKYDYDRDKAGRLLDEAGWVLPPGGEGGVRMKAGEPLALTLMTTSGNRMREQVQVLLQSQWRKLGVELTIKNQPAKVFFGDTIRHRKVEGMGMYAWGMDPARVLDTLWRCDNIPSKENNFQGQNHPGWCHGEAASPGASRPSSPKSSPHCRSTSSST